MTGRVILKAGRERSIRNRHPWIFSGAVETIQNSPSEGDLVEVFSKHGERLGFGHLGEKNIVVRMLAFGDRKYEADYWQRKIESACKLREFIGLNASSETTAYRLFNAEGDGIPGLIIDRYADCAVIEIHSRGVLNAAKEIRDALASELFNGQKLSQIFVRAGSALNQPIEDSIKPGVVASFQENGLNFEADLSAGQKTGFFLDQRENRLLVRRLAQGKSVLNAFSYTGGFALNALKGGAKSVHSVELSKPAISLLERHLALNGLTSGHESFTADCFKFLQETKESYDLLIVDPPAFAKHRPAKSAALRAYESLNELVFKRAAKDSIVLTFSCSLFISREEFREAVYHGATRVGRTIQVLSELQAGADHPVSIYHQEGEYLKGLLLRIE